MGVWEFRFTGSDKLGVHDLMVNAKADSRVVAEPSPLLKLQTGSESEISADHHHPNFLANTDAFGL